MMDKHRKKRERELTWGKKWLRIRPAISIKIYANHEGVFSPLQLRHLVIICPFVKTFNLEHNQKPEAPFHLVYYQRWKNAKGRGMRWGEGGVKLEPSCVFRPLLFQEEWQIAVFPEWRRHNGLQWGTACPCISAFTTPHALSKTVWELAIHSQQRCGKENKHNPGLPEGGRGLLISGLSVGPVFFCQNEQTFLHGES